MNQKTEISYINVAKGIGIFLVVWGHSTANIYIKHFIYLFHMPLFFFVSGYLFNEENLDTPSKFIKKKLRRLYLPFVGWNIFALLFHQLFCRIGLYPKEQIFISWRQISVNIAKILMCVEMEDIASPLWFLPILMAAEMIYFAICYLQKKLGLKHVIVNILTIVLFLAAYIIPNNGNGVIRAFILVVIALFMLNLGAFARKNIITVRKTVEYILLVLAVLFLVIAAFYIDINMIQMRLGNPLGYVLCGVSGIYFIFFISKRTWGAIEKWLVGLGRNSLSVLALHYYAFSIVTFAQKYIYHGDFNGYYGIVTHLADQDILKSIWTLVYVAAGLTLPILIKQIMEYLKTVWRKTRWEESRY